VNLVTVIRTMVRWDDDGTRTERVVSRRTVTASQHEAELDAAHEVRLRRMFTA
jgi:hypothetical protein